MSDLGPCGCDSSLALRALLAECVEYMEHGVICRSREEKRPGSCDCGGANARAAAAKSREQWPTLSERFWSKVAKGDGCWLWTSANDRRGYGVITIDRRSRKAHRVGWELANGRPIPDGLFACHTCDTPACVRPDHIWLGTQLDNVRDAARKGRIVQTPRQSHCGRGHPMTDENVRINKGGKRACRACGRDNARRYAERKRARS